MLSGELKVGSVEFISPRQADIKAKLLNYRVARLFCLAFSFKKSIMAFTNLNISGSSASIMNKIKNLFPSKLGGSQVAI